MKKKKAYKLAIEALERYRQPHAIGANLYMAGIMGDYQEREHKIYVELTEAIEFFRKERENEQQTTNGTGVS